jgi:hypothetical protein
MKDVNTGKKAKFFNQSVHKHASNILSYKEYDRAIPYADMRCLLTSEVRVQSQVLVIFIMIKVAWNRFSPELFLLIT